MSALDGSVVNTVLPLMRRELHTTVASVEWVTTIYLLVVSGILLGVGRAGDLYGHKRSYVGGFFLFVGGSALCGLAPTVGWLVGLRALQALGAQATMTYLGLTVGPPLGGWLAGAFGWRWVFYINVPVGAIAMLLAWKVIPADRPEKAVEPFDPPEASVGVGVQVALGLAELVLRIPLQPIPLPFRLHARVAGEAARRVLHATLHVLRLPFQRVLDALVVHVSIGHRRLLRW